MEKTIRHLPCDDKECNCSTLHRIYYLGHTIKQGKKYAMFHKVCIACFRRALLKKQATAILKKLEFMSYSAWMDLLNEVTAK